MNHLPKMSLLIVALLALPATSPLCAQTKAERTHELLISNVWTAVAIPVALGFDIARSGYKGAFSRDILERRTFWIKVKNSVSAVFTGKNWKERFVGNELTKSFPALGRWTRAKNFVNANPLFMIAMTVALGNVARSGHELYYFEDATRDSTDDKSASESESEREEDGSESKPENASSATPQKTTTYPPLPTSTSRRKTPRQTPSRMKIWIKGKKVTATNITDGTMPTTNSYCTFNNGKSFHYVFQGAKKMEFSPVKDFSFTKPESAKKKTPSRISRQLELNDAASGSKEEQYDDNTQLERCHSDSSDLD